MLALTRKTGERIVIGGNVIITILRINGTVRLGIDAPADVQVLRGELCGMERLPDSDPPPKIRNSRPGGRPWQAAMAVLKAGGTMAEAERAAKDVRNPPPPQVASTSREELGWQHQPMV